MAVYPPDEQPFVTQLYVAGEPRNADDFLYRRIPVEARRLVTVPFEELGEGVLKCLKDERPKRSNADIEANSPRLPRLLNIADH